MSKNPGETVTAFVSAFSTRDVDKLAPYLHPDIEFEAYGSAPVTGRDQVLAVWRGVFSSMSEVAFTTEHQAVNGDVVLEEQVHGLALPGRAIAPIRNMAAYRVADGLITQWRDYSNPEYARTLL
jgi:limonene-1,2-epoxide hydrolase